MTISREDFIGTTQAKSDQVNAADLLGGPLVCQITDIRMTGSPDQPISIYVDAHPQPWKPSKTSRRVLAACWSDADPDQWIGRYVVLYNEPSVKWAGKAEGGIRTSHLSHIDGKKTIMVNETRGKKCAQVVEPYYPDESQAPANVSYYPEDKFEANFGKWAELVLSGQKTHAEILANVRRGGELTAGQVARIEGIKAVEIVEEPPLPEDGDPFDQ